MVRIAMGFDDVIMLPHRLDHTPLTRSLSLSARSAGRKQVVVQAGLQEVGKAAIAGVAAAVIAAVSPSRRRCRHRVLSH